MNELAFHRRHRLLTPRDFKRVMDAPSMRASQGGFVLLASENGLDTARIGFVLPKRRISHAVARNRVKRIMRESFRRQQPILAGLDIVVMARDGLAALDNAAMRAAIDRQFQYLATRRQPRPDTAQRDETR